MSNTFIVVLNFILYATTLAFLYKKKMFGIPSLILWCYTLTSFFCMYNVFFDNTWHLELWPFLWMFIVVMALTSPFWRRNYCLNKNPLNNHNLYRVIAYFYILLSLYSCFVYIPIAYDAIVNPIWADLYDAAHEEKDSNVYTKLANAFFHLKYLGLVLFASFLTARRKNKLFVFILGLMSLLPVILVAITQASRGGMVDIIMSMILIYYLYKNQLKSKTRKNILRITAIIIPVMFIYLAEVTISRFEDNPYIEGASISVLFYLGHSMLVFSDGICDSIQRIGWGAYMFNFMNDKTLDDFFGTHTNTAFFSIAGTIYLDFGPFIGVVIAFIIAFFMVKVGKKNLDVPDVFLLFTYSLFLMHGVFVYGRGYGFQWVETLVIYALLKWLQKAIPSNIAIR